MKILWYYYLQLVGNVMFDRYLMQELINWKNRSKRSPLILRGARQVGKTSLIRQFAQGHFDHCFEINFESDKQYKVCFETFNPADIVLKIEKLSNQKITPGKTVLFLDEIQECVNAISALRYFKEKMPNLHVIAAGSLLEFALESKHLKMPVGRVEFLYLYPLSFEEFLMVQGKSTWLEIMRNAQINKTQDLNLIHDELLKQFNEYLLIGGMPDAVREFKDSTSYYDVKRIQSQLLQTYENDFAKYATSLAEENYLQLLYEKMPAYVAESFKYSKISPDVQSRSLKPALNKLIKAQVIHKVYATSASGLPLKALINEKKFKCLLSDIGLYCASMNLSQDILSSKDIIIVNKGKLSEQVAGQELLAHSIPFEPYQLTYWARDKKTSRAEVDYVIQHGATIIPIEVKSGPMGRMKSLHIFMQEKRSKLGIKISQAPLSLKDQILSLPIYLIGQLDRLLSH